MFASPRSVDGVQRLADALSPLVAEKGPLAQSRSVRELVLLLMDIVRGEKPGLLMRSGSNHVVPQITRGIHTVLWQVAGLEVSGDETSGFQISFNPSSHAGTQ
jgi:hypothetical protein